MKQVLLHIIKPSLLAICALGCAFGFASQALADGIRIVPKSIGVKNDSLHIYLEMDLNSVHVNSLTAVIFTPVLEGQKSRVVLPPVIVTGNKRYRYERRERALATGETRPLPPYRVLPDNSKNGSKNVRYRVSIPFTSWMQRASLLLRQELKDCCDQQLLGVDTLTRQITLKNLPASAAGQIQTAANPSAAVLAKPQRPVQAPARARQILPSVALSSSALETYASMVSFLTPDPGRKSKQRTRSATLYIDYPLGKDEVYPDYKNNREEIDKIDGILRPLLSEGFSEVERIRIRGYASPDGNYRDNERLAAERSRLFAWYVQKAYDIPGNLFDVSSVAEDWEGLEALLRQTKPSYMQAALDVIHRYGVFNGREKHLMDLQGGIPYKEMLKKLFPRLRRIEVVVEYHIRPMEAGEASEIIYTHPDLLSLEEMYAVARYYRPGTDQYREVYEIAAFHFPDDVITNVNAASAVMLTGDLTSAWNYLKKVEADPRAWNNMGVLMLMEGDPEGAAVWFRKAVGVEPRKARTNLQIAESNL